MGLIEKISNNEPGPNPVLVKDVWQVVKINYTEEYEVENIDALYMNENCGLAISLLTGSAILVIENVDNPLLPLKAEVMKCGASYYIPEDVGYTIVMEKGCELFSVESPYELPLKVQKRPLDKKEMETIKISVIKEFKC